jgi:hypothetical protein
MIEYWGGASDVTWPMVLYDNMLARGVFSGGAAAAGTAYENVLGPSTFDYWQPASPTGTLYCTLPTPEDCDCIFIAAHDVGSKGGTIDFQVSPDLVSPYVTVFTFAPSDDAAAGIIFASRSVQRFRFYATDAPAGSMSFGIVSAGLRLVFPAWLQPPYVPMNEARRVKIRNSVSLGGHYLGASKYPSAGDAEVVFSPLPRSFVDGALRGFSKHYNGGGVFFWCGNPAAMPDDIGYCWRANGSGELRPAYLGGGAYDEVKMGLAAYGA